MPRVARTRFVPEDVARLRLPAEPCISPDGRWVVYVEKRPSPPRDRILQSLRLVDTRTGAGRDLTHGEHVDANPAWTPDSRAVVFVSDRDGGENLWRIRLDARAPERLTRLDGRVRTPRVAPDGRHIAFLHAPRSAQQRALDPRHEPPGPTARRLTRLGFKHDGRGFVDAAWMHVWVLDLASGRVRQITGGDCDDGQHDWSPDSRRLAFVSNRIPRADVLFTNSDVYVVAARGGRPRLMTRFRGPKHAPAWSPDGRRIAFIGHGRFPDTVENLHPWVVPAGGGRSHDVLGDADLLCTDALLTDVRDHSDTAPRPVWSATGDRLFFVATQDGATNVWEVDAAGRRPPRPRTFGTHHIADLSQSADGRSWAFVRLTATHPGDVWVATAETAARGAAAAAANAGGRDAPAVPGARVRRLTRLNAALLERRRAVPPVEIAVATHGGHTIRGWFLRAPGSGRRGPVVLGLHGGPHAACGWTFSLESQVLLGHGYHVAGANPRGSAGYGLDFMRALVGKWGHADYEDLLRLTDAVEELPGVDPARIALAGGSYGGYLAAWALAHTRRYRCGIAMRGAYDLVSFFGTSDIGCDLVHEFEAQPPWASVDRWWRVSPLAHVDNLRSPLLLVHPEDDLRCPVSQAEELFTALRVLGRDVEFVRFAGESHGLARSGRPHNRIERLRRILDWLGRKL